MFYEFIASLPYTCAVSVLWRIFVYAQVSRTYFTRSLWSTLFSLNTVFLPPKMILLFFAMCSRHHLWEHLCFFDKRPWPAFHIITIDTISASLTSDLDLALPTVLIYKIFAFLYYDLYLALTDLWVNIVVGKTKSIASNSSLKKKRTLRPLVSLSRRCVYSIWRMEGDGWKEEREREKAIQWINWV